MLQMQGHTVSGISLDPQERSLFQRANLSGIFENDVRMDIRDGRGLARSVEEIDPEIIVHLAAQPLVRETYKYPIATFETNVIGTLNVLEAMRSLKNLKASLIITLIKFIRITTTFEDTSRLMNWAGMTPTARPKLQQI